MSAVAAKVLNFVLRASRVIAALRRRREGDEDKTFPYAILFILLLFLFPILLIASALSFSSDDIGNLSEMDKAWVEWINEQYYEKHPIPKDSEIFIGENGLVNPVGDPDWKKHITSRWGHRNIIVKGKRVSGHHSGLDLAYPKGHPVLAVKDGIVARAEVIGTYGNAVFIDHGGGFGTRYGHLSAILVKAKTPVKAGDVIGLVGSTGRSSGSHLHFEIRINGKDVDPYPYLNYDLRKKEREERP